MTKVELSIIIPAYNCGDKIQTIVDSIIKQPFADWELIIVNDKSTDNTATILNESAKQDKRIKVIHQAQNGGASVARNTGIKQSKGEYLMFFDADDNIKSNTITTFVEEIKRTKAELVVSGFTIATIKNDTVLSTVDVCTNPLPQRKKNEAWPIYILRLLGIDGRLYQVWNKIYRADIIKKNNLQFQPGVNFGEDLVFNLRYLAHMTGRIQFLPQALYIYNQSLDAGTFSQSSLIYQNRLDNYDELVKLVKGEPNTATKISLLSWIQYNWLYSHLLAVGQSNLSATDKLTNIKLVASQFAYPPLSDPGVIGSKKVRLEKLLGSLIAKPRTALTFIKLSNYAKNNPLTAKLWRQLKQQLNH